MYAYFFSHFLCYFVDEKRQLFTIYWPIQDYIITFSLQRPEGFTHNWQIPS